FEHSVAIMGVALGDNSLIKLLALTKNVILSLDNDQAGWKASIRVNAQFMAQGITPRFIDLGEHKDPDEFLVAKGATEFSKRVEEAKPFVDVQIEREFPEQIPELAERKLELLERVFEVLSPLKNSLSASERVITYAKRLGLQSDSASIVKNYEDYLDGVRRKENRAPAPPPIEEEFPPMMDYEIPMEEKVELDRQLTTVEVRLLQNLVQHPELLLKDEMAELLDFVGNDEVKSYILKLSELMYEIDESEYISVVQRLMSDDHYTAELTAVVGGALYRYQDNSLEDKVALKMIEDIKKSLQVEQLKIEKQFLKEQQGRAQTQEEQHNILQKLMTVDKQLIEIRTTNRYGKTSK
ncbi:MAG: toprim domain-containing protein, partial [Bdellovibrionota bacterium]|nr:toprim domain-containing protein [Bdellovibrionota bacterium]